MSEPAGLGPNLTSSEVSRVTTGPDRFIVGPDGITYGPFEPIAPGVVYGPEHMAARAAETASMAPEPAGDAITLPFPSGGSGFNQRLKANRRNLTTGNVRTVVAETVRTLAERAEAGDTDAHVQLYRLFGTLRNQAAVAKRALRLRRQGSERESPELGAAAKRLLGGLAQRAEEGDLMALHELAVLRNELREQTTRAARGLHTPDVNGHAYSWREIGQAAGITLQAAEKRWGER